ncbi:MAG: hypothetical protein WDO56_15245 [Gammaproteobacteria bacterium]
MSGASVTLFNVKDAVRPVLSRVTVPAGLAQGAAHVTVKLAAPDVSATGSLNVPVIAVVFVDTFVAAAAGTLLVTVGRATATSPPKIVSFPPPHPATTRHTSRGIPRVRRMYPWNLFIELLGTNFKTLDADG